MTRKTLPNDAEPGEPLNRLHEIIKQAKIAAEDLDDHGAVTYAQRCAGCAESALILLEGPDIEELGGDDE